MMITRLALLRTSSEMHRRFNRSEKENETPINLYRKIDKSNFSRENGFCPAPPSPSSICICTLLPWSKSREYPAFIVSSSYVNIFCKPLLHWEIKTIFSLFVFHIGFAVKDTLPMWKRATVKRPRMAKRHTLRSCLPPRKVEQPSRKRDPASGVVC